MLVLIASLRSKKIDNKAESIKFQLELKFNLTRRKSRSGQLRKISNLNCSIRCYRNEDTFVVWADKLLRQWVNSRWMKANEAYNCILVWTMLPCMKVFKILHRRASFKIWKVSTRKMGQQCIITRFCCSWQAHISLWVKFLKYLLTQKPKSEKKIRKDCFCSELSAFFVSSNAQNFSRNRTHVDIHPNPM